MTTETNHAESAPQAGEIARPSRFSRNLYVRCPPALVIAIETAAQRQCTTTSEYVRRSTVDRLSADGIEVGDLASPSAGHLYNVVDGKRSYALISGDRIVTMGYRASEPALSDYAPGRGDRVLPVEYEDSEPFDILKHWRLPPIDAIEAERVVRTFPVIPKSLEAM